MKLIYNEVNPVEHNNNLIKKTYGWSPKKNIFDIVKDNYKWLMANKKQLLKIQ